MHPALGRSLAVVAALTIAALVCAACDGGRSDAGDAEPTRPAVARSSPRAAATTRACAPPSPVAAPTADTVFCADPVSMQPARVIRIIDGDTFVAQVDGHDETVRFFGIDTAERGEPCFTEASERLDTLAGSDVRLLPDQRDRDRNGRLLRYVYTPSGLSIDAVLINEGLARAWTRDGALRLPLIELEARAAAARTGCLWAPSSALP